MNIFQATMLAEGVEKARCEGELREAWQLLIDTGTAYKLQSWFGRTANNLIEDGVCNPPPGGES